MTKIPFEVLNMTNPLRALRDIGQSVWLDDLSRQFLEDGTLEKLVDQDGVSGLTSNPAIFQRALQESRSYDACIQGASRRGDSTTQIYEQLVIDDVQRAADMLRPVYDESRAADGYVSLEVNPHLAHDTDATIAEARRLWASVARPNLMIKVPGTLAGLPAIYELIAAGININVTLLFSTKRYRQVIDAFWSALEHRSAHGMPIETVASVASLFISRIDTAVDKLLNDSPACMSVSLHGAAAVSVAACAYQSYRESIVDSRWHALAQRGARPQRLLWASTGTKDPAYGDIKYVEALIGPDTITTLPMKILIAYREHGDPRPRIHELFDKAVPTLGQLAILGIDIERVGDGLERDGVKKFVDAYDALLVDLAGRRRRIMEGQDNNPGSQVI